jgi:predicted Rossmann fold nucleotide-binding protein DprA/Smf involved in DNA uptake
MMAEPFALTPNDAEYPQGLLQTLGDEAPGQLACLGNVALLAHPLLAVFCSVKCPASLIVTAQDTAHALRNEGTATISGFHAPVEKEMLTVLLKGKQPVVVVVARGLETMRVPNAWNSALDAGRLLILSPFSAKHRRSTEDMALIRNHTVAALAEAVLFCHAAPGGKTEVLAAEVLVWGKSCLTLDSSHNTNLLTLGFQPLRQ